MNAISPKDRKSFAEAVLPFPMSASVLAAEIVKQQESLDDIETSWLSDGAYKRQMDRQYAHVRAMQDLLLTMRSEDLAGCIAQMIILSSRLCEDAELETKEEIREAIEDRVGQQQALTFRMLRMLNLDPAALGADTYIGVGPLESEGYTPPWARDIGEAGR
jgi:hypothetical protein